MSLALDLAVARCLDRGPITGADKYGAPMISARRSLAALIEKYADFPQAWSPTTNWTDAGPILERMYGRTFLLNSMRAFVRSQTGEDF